MLLVALLLSSWADPDRPLARPGEQAAEQTWAGLDGPPYRPKWRNRRGRYRCLSWPDGVAARCDERLEAGGRVVHRFDAGGGLRARVAHTDRPVSVEIADARTPVDVGAWQPHTVALMSAWLPAGRVDVAPDGLSWTDGLASVRLTRRPAPGADVRSDAFREGLRAACACLLIDRTTDDLDGRFGVRYRFELPHGAAPRIGEAWAATIGEDLVALTFSAPAGDDGALAIGRAIASLISIEAAP